MNLLGATLKDWRRLRCLFVDSGQLRRISAAALQNFDINFKLKSREIPQDDDVLFDTRKNTGVIALNRTKALNCLNMSMFSKIFPTLCEWERTLAMVIVKGVGEKSFCSGGDVTAIVNDAKAKGNLYKDFFTVQYTQNYLIGTYRIPYIALIDGITMGGGAGLAVHGQFRVATERTLFAMPEVAIGFFTDVGTSHFLPRLSNSSNSSLGIYLALTGYRLSPSDTLQAGIATHACKSADIGRLEEDLINLEDKSVPRISEVLNYYTKLAREEICFQDPPLQKADEKIRQHFNHRTVEDIVNSLESDCSQWAQNTLKMIQRMCPLSLKVSLKSLLDGSKKNLQDCLRTEYRLSQRFSRGYNLSEGARALLVEKDKNPKWDPPTLQEVTDEMVDEYFKPLPSPEDELSF